ncbi:hypothetical protein KQ881_16165, partial [Listeria monocytogenes]|nr:hypothetical protein [Listeria monocytogenes]
GLLYTLIRHGAASKVASLFYLVPPVPALASWLLFDERLAPAAIGGMLLVMRGVAAGQLAGPARLRPQWL